MSITSAPPEPRGSSAESGLPLLDQSVTVWVRGVERHIASVVADGHTRRELGHLLYLGWKDVATTAIPAAHLADIAARVRTESVIDYVSFASAELLAAPPPNVHHQCLHARMLLNGSTLERSLALLSVGGRDAFIHQEQLLSAAKLAIHHGQRGPGRSEDLHDIGILLLSTSDALMDLEPGSMSEQEMNARIRALVARRGSFLTCEGAVALIARYDDLLLRRPDGALASRRITVDFDDRFNCANGWRIVDFMTAAHFCTVPFLRPQAAGPRAPGQPPAAQPEESVPWRDIGTILREVDADGYTDRVADRLALNRNELASVLSGPAVDISHRERIELYRHPLFRREDGTVTPLNLAITAENMSIGAYWALHGACAQLDPRAGVNEVTSAIGALFEDYVDDLLVRAYIGGSAPGALYREARRAHRDPADDHRLLHPYRAADGNTVDPIDAVVVEDGGMVILEATVRTIPLEALVGGVAGDFDRYVSRIVEKVEQTGRFVRDVSEGRVNLPGASPSAPVEAFPVVVLLHAFPQHYTTWELLEEAVEARGHLAISCPWITMREPQLLTAEELELLEPHLHDGLSLIALLREKIASPQYRHRSMKDFLLRGKRLEERANDHLEMLFNYTFDRIRPHISQHLTVPWDTEAGVRGADTDDAKGLTGDESRQEGASGDDQ